MRKIATGLAYLLLSQALVPAYALAPIRCDEIGVVVYGENSYLRTARSGPQKGKVRVERYFHPIEREFTIHSTAWKRIFLKLPLAQRKKSALVTVKTEASGQRAGAKPVTISGGPFVLKTVENELYPVDGAIFSNLIPAQEYFPGQLKIFVEQNQSPFCEQTIELLKSGD